MTAEVRPNFNISKIEILLDELTAKNLTTSMREFISYDFTSDEQKLQQVVATILKIVAKKPILCSNLAKLCRCQIIDEKERNDDRRNFKTELLNQTEYLFKNDHETQFEVSETENMNNPMKFRPFFIVFYAFLYLHDIVSFDLIRSSIDSLTPTIENATNNIVDQKSSLCGLIIVYIFADSNLKNISDQTELREYLDQWLNRIYSLRFFLAKTNQSVLIGLLEWRKKGWRRKPENHHIEILREYSRIEDEPKNEQYHLIQQKLKKYLDEITEKDEASILNLEIINSEIRRIRTNQSVVASLLEWKTTRWTRKNEHTYIELIRLYSKIDDEAEHEQYPIIQQEVRKHLGEITKKDEANASNLESINSEIRRIRCEVVKSLKEDKDLEKLVCPILSPYASEQ